MSNSTCRGCGQNIEWIKTSKGKNMPLDPDSYSWDDLADGDFAINSVGEVKKKTNSYTPPEDTWRISHFSTCPKANEFKR
jgi:hypothetical protein